jgi:hypothetical protein
LAASVSGVFIGKERLHVDQAKAANDCRPSGASMGIAALGGVGSAHVASCPGDGQAHYSLIKAEDNDAALDVTVATLPVRQETVCCPMPLRKR